MENVLLNKFADSIHNPIKKPHPKPLKTEDAAIFKTTFLFHIYKTSFTYYPFRSITLIPTPISTTPISSIIDSGSTNAGSPFP